ncbi:hypothetical protein PLESTB_001896400 [Pleodorina starrii]|uniref:Ankyrin repeat domain-containing protein n=1 Tax=Pleodorina starrii TaxID=330485 RepID=A0A9W6C1U9_9CHLO|nr:hypothetical protein PLESTM_001946600 [Pleodorina starrii]GLC62409.1 hypothetical protein PLESTB_001896400 [Pleodorina starrii]GLC77288.1 hypothetical protein PLESTF_001915800 [Pleodorina starrii]
MMPSSGIMEVAVEESDSCSWDALAPEVVLRIACCLSPNEVACTLRIITKATAKLFKSCISVQLSMPVPHHAFVFRWGNERAVHDLTLEQRQQLLCLTARTGVVANLEVAVNAVGCRLTDRVFNAAVEAGQLDACAWLEDRDCPHEDRAVINMAACAGHAAIVRWKLEQDPNLVDEALEGAASGGHCALCEELLAADAYCSNDVANLAAAAGHDELTEWLLERLEEPLAARSFYLYHAAAYGFELPALQRLIRAQLGSGNTWPDLKKRWGSRLAAAAVCSPTPDWRAKLEWLEDEGCRIQEEHGVFVFRAAEPGVVPVTRQEHAVERVALLRERGLLDVGSCLQDAVAGANLPLLQYLRTEGLLTTVSGTLKSMTMSAAMERGDLAILAELLAAGWPVDPFKVMGAARRGHLHVLRWLEGPEAGPAAAEALHGALLQGTKLMERGAGSGSLAVMEWLWERGCPSDEHTFTAAAGAGNTAILELLVARGCPMSDAAYQAANRNGDTAILHSLRRLGCPGA